MQSIPLEAEIARLHRVLEGKAEPARPAGKAWDVAETLLAAGYSASHVATVSGLDEAQVWALAAARAAQ